MIGSVSREDRFMRGLEVERPCLFRCLIHGHTHGVWDWAFDSCGTPVACGSTGSRRICLYYEAIANDTSIKAIENVPFVLGADFMAIALTPIAPDCLIPSTRN